MFRRQSPFLWGLLAIVWLVPDVSIEIHISLTFAMLMFAEIWRIGRAVKREPPEPDSPPVPPKARTLSLLDASPLQEDNS